MMEFHPITAERLPDLVRFFEQHGNPNYCWCMRWRLAGSEFARLKSAGRKRALRKLVRTGTPVGILGYLDGEPVGWCSVAPRETYTLLQRSRTIPRLDDQITWSVVCFFVAPERRGQHVTVELLRAAVDYARSQGAQVVEGYPVEPRRDAAGGPFPVTYRFMGYVSAFRKAGFREVASLDKGRRIMRYRIKTVSSK
jgi:GNAT superfamily N-acetyltransferase